MSGLVAVADALGKLTRLAGVTSAVVHALSHVTLVSLNGSDAAVRAFAAEHDVPVSLTVSVCRRSEWLEAIARVGDITITLTGPHRDHNCEISPAPIDHAAVDAIVATVTVAS